jgi:hypothetical protein
MEKIYTKRPQNIPKGHKILQIPIKIGTPNTQIQNGQNFPFQGLQK